MPRRTKRKRRSKPRRSRKRRRFAPKGGRKSIVRIRRPTGFPDTTMVTLKYTMQKPFTTAQFDYIFSINSVFDPDVTAGGHQPLAYDEWTTMYQRYQVLGCKIRTKWINTLTLNDCQITFYPSTEAAPALSQNEAKEQPYSRSMIVGNSHSGHNIVSRSAYQNVSKFMGIAATDVTLTASTSLSPSRRCYWHIRGESLDGTTSNNIFIETQLIYYVRFFDRRVLFES